MAARNLTTTQAAAPCLDRFPVELSRSIRLLCRSHACDAPLCDQGTQCGRLERLVQDLDVARTCLVAHQRRPVGGDQYRGQIVAEAPTQCRDRLDAVAAIEMVIDQ